MNADAMNADAKGPEAEASGELGRKRPRRATRRDNIRHLPLTAASRDARQRAGKPREEGCAEARKERSADLTRPRFRA
jgi:hypothetical protein